MAPGHSLTAYSLSVADPLCMLVRLFADFVGVLMCMYMYVVIPENLAIFHAVKRLGCLGQNVELMRNQDI